MRSLNFPKITMYKGVNSEPQSVVNLGATERSRVSMNALSEMESKFEAFLSRISNGGVSTPDDSETTAARYERADEDIAVLLQEVNKNGDRFSDSTKTLVV